MLIERDGSDTPPSRFAYSVGNRAQLSHIDKNRAIKTAAQKYARTVITIAIFS